jgi:hypothetical protein
MNPHLHYILAQQRVAELQRAAERARLATDADTRRRDSRDSNPIVRALPMPTAHPSPEAWPAASLPAGTSPTPARTSARPAPCRTSTEHTLTAAARVLPSTASSAFDTTGNRSNGPASLCVHDSRRSSLSTGWGAWSPRVDIAWGR